MSVQTVRDRLHEVAAARPHARAVTIVLPGGAPDVSFSYRELLANVRPLVNRLVCADVGPGAVVLLLFDHGPELVLSLLAAIELGAVPCVVAPPSFKIAPAIFERTLRSLLASSGARHVVTTAAHAAALEELAKTVRVLRVDPPSPGAPAEQANGAPPYRGDADAEAILQYSSGTTGLRKGVALSNRCVLAHVDKYAEAIGLSHDDRIVSWLPLYHDMGLIACFLLPLLRGVPVTMMSAFDWVRNPMTLLELVDRERATLSWMPNFAYSLMARRASNDDVSRLDLRSLRGLVNCSEPIRSESHATFMERFGPCGLDEAALWTCYAMAETTFAVSQGGVTECVKTEEIDGQAYATHGIARPATTSSRTRRAVVASGRPIAGCEVRIVDPERRACAERVVGEIAVRTSTMLHEYRGQPELSRRVIADGWYHTGDLGYLADGHLFVTGRKSDRIVISGRNIHAEDVEDAISTVDGVHPGRAVAFGVDNAESGTEDLVVVAEAKSGVDDPEVRRAIAAAVRERIDCALSDVRLVPHMTLVKSSSGKLARSANRERYVEARREHRVETK